MPPASHASSLSYAHNLACSGQPCKGHGLWLQVRGSHGLQVRENLWHGKGSARDALTVQVKCDVRTFAGGKIGGGYADAYIQLILARSSACKSYVKLIYPRNQCLIPVSISFSSQEHAHISVAHCHNTCMTSIPKSRTSTRLSAWRRVCSASSVSSVCSTSSLLQIVPILARRIRRHSQCSAMRIYPLYSSTGSGPISNKIKHASAQGLFHVHVHWILHVWASNIPTHPEH